MSREGLERAWDELGLGPRWVRRVPAGVGEPATSPQPGGGDPDEPQSAGDSWEAMRSEVSQCRLCGLCESRRQTVFGGGSLQARWMLIGEAPGADEDAQGEPFVGMAGRLLDQMLAAIQLSRATDVFITNVLKCRPPGNRNPEPLEAADVFGLPPSPDRTAPAGPDPAARALCGSKRARYRRQCREPAATGPSLPGTATRNSGRLHLPPGLPAAEPAGQAQELGGLVPGAGRRGARAGGQAPGCRDQCLNRSDGLADLPTPASLQYRRPLVRDLAWLVLDGALPLPPASGDLRSVRLSTAERHELLELLAAWDNRAQDDWLGPIDPRLRLGIYTERLIGAWLRHSRLIRLVAMNWPLRDGRTTIGEADFLVERLSLPGDRLQLWELACKFYLGVAEVGWIGPGLLDSLDAKLSRIRSHQLPLIHRPGFREAWGCGLDGARLGCRLAAGTGTDLAEPVAAGKCRRWLGRAHRRRLGGMRYRFGFHRRAAGERSGGDGVVGPAQAAVAAAGVRGRPGAAALAPVGHGLCRLVACGYARSGPPDACRHPLAVLRRWRGGRGRRCA